MPQTFLYRTVQVISKIQVDLKRSILYSLNVGSRRDTSEKDEEIRHGLLTVSCRRLLKSLGKGTQFDLILSSPPYNIGKPYEQELKLSAYLAEQEKVIVQLVNRLKPTGSLCWQVGTHVQNGGATKGSIFPLDILFHPVFQKHGLRLRNRIVWRFGHGLHCKHRFSGRYETILWYTKNEDYKFNLDAVRIPSKYPGKRSYKGPNRGKLSSHPKGKNPEDVWDFSTDVWEIPNVKGNHIEKTKHPCQFPVGLAERLILALTDEEDLVFDPYAGVGTTGVAAALHGRRFLGTEINADYAEVGRERIGLALTGMARFRSHLKPIYDHKLSSLSRMPAHVNP